MEYAKLNDVSIKDRIDESEWRKQLENGVFKGFNLLFGNVHKSSLTCFTNQNDPTKETTTAQLTGVHGIANGGLAPWKKVQDALYRFNLVVDSFDGNFALN
jgi:uncharacterized protein with NRDE domain